MRSLSAEERNVITRISEKLGEREREQLLNDMEHASVNPVSEDGSLVEFEISGNEHPPYRGHSLYPVEGKLRDSDGAELCVLLNADENGRLLALEIIRWSTGDLLAPDWGTLELY